jgi:hypothetical protein
MLFPLLVYLTDAWIIVHLYKEPSEELSCCSHYWCIWQMRGLLCICTRSRVNSCHAVPTTGVFDRCVDYCAFVQGANWAVVMLFPRLVYLTDAWIIVHLYKEPSEQLSCCSHDWCIWQMRGLLCICTRWSQSLCAPDDYSTKNTHKYLAITEYIRNVDRGILCTVFGVSINVWRLKSDTLNITCNFMYCNLQVQGDFLITLYKEPSEQLLCCSHDWCIWQAFVLARTNIVLTITKYWCLPRLMCRLPTVGGKLTGGQY